MTDSILDRIEASGLTIARASTMDDSTLLRMPLIGRKCLRLIRSYQGPTLPVPALYVPPKNNGEPDMDDYMDEDGYVDYEAYDLDWDRWRDRQDFEYDQIPSLRENWCPLEADPVMTFEDIDILAIVLED